MKKKVIIPILVVLALIALIVYTLANNKKKIDEQKKPAETSEIATPVNVKTVTRTLTESKLVKTGNLVPYKEADITSLSSGNLISLNFELGSKLSQGATVAQVDSRSLKLNLEAAELARSKAEKDYNRFKALLEGEAATEVNYLDAKLNFDNASNQIDLIKKQIEDSRIKAPISGQVVSKFKESGEYVNPGTILGHIVDVSKLKVNVMVSENDVYTLKLGQKVKVNTEIYPNVTFEGKVIFISDKGDATHNYQVEVEMINSVKNPLKAGTFAYVDFSKQSEEQLLIIPRSALVESLKNPYVYVIQDSKAVARKIQIGKEIGDGIVVLEGLSEGDQVITSGQVNITEGSLVRGLE